MAFKVADRVKEIITTPGTGNLILSNSGVSGFQTFQNALSDSDYTYYVIDEYDAWETGYGQFINGEFSRDVIFDSSYNSGQRIHVAGSGEGHISITYPAERAVYLTQDNLYTVAGSGVTFINDPDKVLNTTGNDLYWNGNLIAYEVDNIYVSGIATYASGQSISNQEDISYISGISVYASGQTIKQYDNISSDTVLENVKDILFIDSTSSEINVYIPTAVGNGGKEIKIKRAYGNNLVTIHASGTETIDGQANYHMHHLYESSTFVSNNTSWFLT